MTLEEPSRREDMNALQSKNRAIDQVILVDQFDREIGYEEKVEAHRHGGKLHRAFSVFIRNRRGSMLIQKRAVAKYHFGGLWSNTCCSHPRKGEELADAARRRLVEECGFDAELEVLFSFTYSATDSKTGLTEREFVHVFRGEYDGPVNPVPAEIEELRWVDVRELEDDLAANPQRYAPWFAIALPRVVAIP